MKKSIFLLAIALVLFSCNDNSVEDTINNNYNNTNTIVKDIDGNVYQTIKICNQIWMQSNLNVSKYKNGDVIPQVIDEKQWANLTSGAWCYFNNESSNGPKYGKLYNWYAVNDHRGLAPEGWHIPSSSETSDMYYNCLGGRDVAGGKMKEKGYTHWSAPNTGATNESGFTALSCGERISMVPGPTATSVFTNFGLNANWWTNTGDPGQITAMAFTVLYDRAICYNFGTAKQTGYSVRCVKN